MRFPQTAL